MNTMTKYGRKLSETNTARCRLLVTEELTICLLLTSPERLGVDMPEHEGSVLISVSRYDDEEDVTSAIDAVAHTPTIEEATEIFLQADPIRLFEHVLRGGPGVQNLDLREMDPLPETGLSCVDFDDLFNGDVEDDDE